MRKDYFSASDQFKVAEVTGGMLGHADLEMQQDLGPMIAKGDMSIDTLAHKAHAQAMMEQRLAAQQAMAERKAERMGEGRGAQDGTMDVMDGLFTEVDPNKRKPPEPMGMKVALDSPRPPKDYGPGQA